MEPAAYDWVRTDRVFSGALELAPGDRAAYLGEACGEETELRGRVERLLAAHDHAETFLEHSPGSHAATLLAELDAPPDAAAAVIGTRVGPYEVLREVGRGGMGVVFLANRADGAFEQQVALKLLKRGTDTDAVVRRFVRERSLLARLEHPGIARLLDGGTTENGLPYFAMEYVEGEPLTDYCDRLALPVEARLRLFVDVCRAVEYAHQRLVVHRDLKPANILVAPRGPEGRPQVKLLDFGIARVLTEDDDPSTWTSVPALTPAYAAPEQAVQGPITTATDVYALGVVLHELLAGARPSARSAGPRSGAGAGLGTGQPEPPRPSSAADRSGAAISDEVAALRSVTGPQLRRQLAGNLDAIVLKALQADPAERYATPARLLDDVERHLAGLPIEARRAQAWERIRGTVRRHPAAVVSGAVFVLLILGYAATVTVQARLLARERDRTAIEARKAEAVTEYLSSLFEVSDPFGETSRGDTLTARMLLARGTARAETELADQPLVRAQLMDRIGIVYANLGLFPEADAALLQALRDRRRLLGPDHPEVAATLGNLASVRWQVGRYDDAERLYRDALAIGRRPGRAPDVQLAEHVNNLGSIVHAQGRWQEAEALHRQSLAILQTLPDRLAAEHVAISYNDLAWAIQSQGRLAEAERYFREAIERFTALYGPTHPYVIKGEANLARVLLAQGRSAEAERAALQAIGLAKRALPEGHPLIARYENHYGEALTQLGRYEEAEAVLLRSHAILLGVRGPDHFHVTDSRARLAALYEAWGQPERASRYR